VYGVIVQYHRLVLIIAFATIFPYLYLRPSLENYGYAKFFQQIAFICFLSIIGENPSGEVMEWRAADIALGCLVGVLVALVVFPTWAYPHWQKAQHRAWQDLQTWFEAILAEYQSDGFDRHRLQQLSRTTQSSVFKLDDILFTRQQELWINRRDYRHQTVLVQVQARVLKSYERLYQILLYLMQVAEHSKAAGQARILPPVSREMVQQIQAAFAEISTTIGTRHPSQIPPFSRYQVTDRLQTAPKSIHPDTFNLDECNVPLQLNQVADAIAEFTASRNELLAKLIPVRPLPSHDF
jgi:hypothetical protein